MEICPTLYIFFLACLASSLPTRVYSQRRGGGRNGRNSGAETCQVNCARTGTVQNVTCALDPESVEGPYYLPLHLLRQNIIEDRTGVPLTLHLIIVDSNACARIKDATVDIWHADANGIYSGVAGPAPPGTTFLRGVQQSDAEGEVTFQTIYPGWYPGRCIHIHIEVFVGGSLKHTGQLFFTPELNNAVKTAQPYASKTERALECQADRIYTQSGGLDTTFNSLDGSVQSGFTGIMYIGIDPTVVRTPMRG